MNNNNNSKGKKKFSYNPNKATARKEALNIQLINKDTVLLSGAFSIFTENLRGLIKSLEGKFDNESKGWIMPRNYVDTLLNRIEADNMNIPLAKIPAMVEKMLKPFSGVIVYKTKSETVKIEYNIEEKLKKITELSEYMQSKLYDFQKKGIEFGIKNFGRVLIADEMGVGKTIQALGLACMYKSEWPFLVIAPSSLRYNWRDEVLRWIDDIGPKDIQVITKSSSEIKRNIKVLIMSYDLASKMSENLEDFNFQIAILDEAHYLKNSDAKRTENLLPIIKRCRRCILLTGTPAFAKPKELYNLLHIIRPDIFTNFREFGQRYCDPKPNRWSGGLDYNGATNVKELHYMLLNSVMIRRLKKDVLSELPPKRRQKIEIKTESSVVKKIQELLSKTSKSDIASILDNMMGTFFSSDADLEEQAANLEKEKGNEYPNVLQCYTMTGLAKINGIQEYLHDLLQNDIKVLVFAHHTEVLDGIETEIKKMKLKYIRIDGSVPTKKRYEAVKLFQENEDVKVAVLSLTAAGVGLNFTAASTVVFAEMHWTPAIMMQAEDRIHRLGQKDKICVNYHYLYGEGTLDSLLYEKLQTKMAIVSDILDGKVDYLNVEEKEDKIGDFNKREKSSSGGKKQKTLPTKIIEGSNGEKKTVVGGMFQITSYFTKKAPVSSSEIINKAEQSQLNKKILNDMEKGESLDWDAVEELLKEDREKKSSLNLEESKTGDMDVFKIPEEDDAFYSCAEELFNYEQQQEADNKPFKTITYNKKLEQQKDNIIFKNISLDFNRNTIFDHKKDDLAKKTPVNDLGKITPMTAASSTNVSGQKSTKGLFKFTVQPRNESNKSLLQRLEEKENNNKKRKAPDESVDKKLISDKKVVPEDLEDDVEDPFSYESKRVKISQE